MHRVTDRCGREWEATQVVAFIEQNGKPLDPEPGCFLLIAGTDSDDGPFITDLSFREVLRELNPGYVVLEYDAEYGSCPVSPQFLVAVGRGRAAEVRLSPDGNPVIVLRDGQVIVCDRGLDAGIAAKELSVPLNIQDRHLGH